MISSLGYYHFLVAQMLDTVAEVHSYQENFTEAIAFQEEVLHITKEVYGGSHVIVGVFSHRLGEKYQHAGDQRRALKYYQFGMELKKRVFGSNHESIAFSKQQIANIHLQLVGPVFSSLSSLSFSPVMSQLLL